MTTNQSIVAICADADKAACNAAYAAITQDSVGADNFSVQLADANNAVFWGAAWAAKPDWATAWKDFPTGVLPTDLQTAQGGAIDWATYGLDETSALAAGAKMTVQVTSDADGSSALTNFNSLKASLGLSDYVEEN